MIRKICCALLILAIFIAGCSQYAAGINTEDINSEAPADAGGGIPSGIPTNTAGGSVGSPTNTPIEVSGKIPAEIKTNPSVNRAWGGQMCEAGGAVYYVADGGKGKDAPVHIARMNPDGSETAVTGEYATVYGLTADDNNLYFLAATSRETSGEALYTLPLSGDKKELKMRDWDFGAPQAAGGRLYWEQDSNPDSKDNVTSIMSMNPDGTDARQLLFVPVPYSSPFYFLATPDGLYYSCPADPDGDACALFYTDLQGQNKVQLNKQKLDRIDTLFYDENNLYFITLNYDKGDGLYSTVNRMDANGGQSVVLQHIDYFPQDDGANYFCGVSGNVFYYFGFDGGGMRELHSYDMIRMQDNSIAKADTDERPVLRSVRGMTIDVQSSHGFYILGNDLYYSFYDEP